MMGFEIPVNGYGHNNSSLKKDQMIIRQKIALDWSKESNGFMHKEMHLKKTSNVMHCWVLNSRQTQRKDLDMFAALSLFSGCQNKQAVRLKRVVVVNEGRINTLPQSKDCILK